MMMVMVVVVVVVVVRRMPESHPLPFPLPPPCTWEAACASPAGARLTADCNCPHDKCGVGNAPPVLGNWAQFGGMGNMERLCGSAVYI